MDEARSCEVGPAAMPAPRAKRGRAGHDVSASLEATGLSTVVLKPFLSVDFVGVTPTNSTLGGSGPDGRRGWFSHQVS